MQDTDPRRAEGRTRSPANVPRALPPYGRDRRVGESTRVHGLRHEGGGRGHEGQEEWGKRGEAHGG